MSTKDPDVYSRVIIALDFPGAVAAESFLAHWDGQRKPFIKVGYQLFYAVGPDWVAKRKEEGYSVFLDLKLHDIPNTVAKGIESLSRLGVDMLTIHAGGGRAMMEAAREAAEAAGGPRRMKLLAVTQLTSTDQQMLNQELGIPGSLEECVIRYAQLAERSGADGVICSGQEVANIKRATSPSFLAVTPGIRPAGTDVQDQKRVVTPADALASGADYLVVGRPITRAADPKAAFDTIIAEMEQAKEG
ncbi:orotidine-5'-phosphate decarboxylase [Lihuaxuella thermophila]|uniref:Orotidine 5'-phosphate decarboxylase n=1 Tax=Lihuaxuella thermophila TaxID=1173111 RepID=A0A1H8ED83_9BACL|nr:orotidine-5'-phosphate decarboxylase [Lihuaxuella thermophila]SEN16777.1 orotidine-5'-phosphate decarboxylase [Lihuaxuella thermophila]